MSSLIENIDKRNKAMQDILNPPKRAKVKTMEKQIKKPKPAVSAFVPKENTVNYIPAHIRARRAQDSK